MEAAGPTEGEYSKSPGQQNHEFSHAKQIQLKSGETLPAKNTLSRKNLGNISPARKPKPQGSESRGTNNPAKGA